MKDLTEEEKAEVLAEQGKELTKEEKAKVADGLAALSEGMGGMSGTMSKGFVGQPRASQVPFTRVGMAEGGMAEGGIRNMYMGGEAAFSFAPLGNLDLVLED